MLAKNILVTGCSSGIGEATVKVLVGRGHNVVATVRKESDKIKLQEEGIEHVVILDLGDSESIKSGFNTALQCLSGRLDALFNNGAFGLPGAVEDLTREALRDQFETNVFGTHELTRLALPYLLQAESGRIIQNSSVLGFTAMPMRGAYVASKFALEGLSDALRMELSETRVKVSIIEPGPILTRFRQNALAAMERYVDISSSRHKARYEGALTRLKKKGAASKFTLAPEAVAAKVVHALESRRPKTRYAVTFPTYLFAVLRRLFPASLLDRIVIAAAKGEG